MRVAVIGAGSIGKRHLTNLRALGHEAVVIDTRSSVREWARAEGYETHGINGLIGMHTAPDAVVIATPAPAHLFWLRDCVKQHLPVLVEKPLGIVADLLALRELRPAAPVMVGYQLRFHPEVRRVQPKLSNAAAGLFRCRCDMLTWPGSAGHGDMLLEMSHEIDLALHCGAPAVATAITAHMNGQCDLAAIHLGAFTVSLAARYQGYLRHWEWFDQPRGSYDVLYTSAAQYDHDATGMYRDELAHFLRAVEGGPIAPGCTLEEGIAVLEVVETVKQMAVSVVQ